MKWKTKQINDKLFKQLKKAGHHTVIAKMFAARYDNMVEIDQILNVSEYSPFLYNEMETVITLLQEAEKVYILTDFDCDGIGSNAVLSKGFEAAGIPYAQQTGERRSERKYATLGEKKKKGQAAGYGFHKGHVDNAIKAGCDTIITADVGIAATKTADYAIEKGLTLIITDHHKVQKDLGIPECHALIDPQVSDETYPFKHHAGVGIAYKVIQALIPKMDKRLEQELLEIVTLSTVTDVAQVTGENRYWIQKGIKYLEDPINLGIRELGILMGLPTQIKKEGSLNIRSAISFALGPCFNAISRMQQSGKLGRDLLCTQDKDIAKLYANELFAMNKERRKVQDKMVRRCKKEKELMEDRVVVMAHPDNHSAVCGICASKIVDKTFHPTIILNEGADGVISGSGRSTDKINLFAILESLDQSLLKGWGGHEAAAGMTLNCDVNTFRTALNEAVKDYDPELFEPVLDTDCEVMLQDLTYDLMDEINALEPFGQGNLEPQFFAMGKPMYGGIRYMNSEKEENRNKNIMLWLQGTGDDHGQRRCVGWNLAERAAEGQHFMVQVSFTPSINSYTDKEGKKRKGIQLVLKDIVVG